MIPEMNETLYEVISKYPHEAIECFETLTTADTDTNTAWNNVAPNDRSLILGCAQLKLMELLGIVADNAADSDLAKDN